MSVISKLKLLAKLRKKAYRDAYVEEHVKTSLPFQIRTMREQPERNWSQAELGSRAGMRQNAISRLEKADYGNLSVNTLLRLASAFDVALLIKFVPFRKLMQEFSDLSTQALEVPSFDEEIELLESQSTADVSDFQIVRSRVVQLQPPMFYGGGILPIISGAAESETNEDWVASETNDWTQWFSNVEQVYVIHPDEDDLAGFADDWSLGHAHLVKGGTTEEIAELVM